MDSSTRLCTTEGKTDEKADDTQETAELHPRSPIDQIPDASAPDDSMHSLFRRFEAFKFSDDKQFQAGLSKISACPDFNKETDLLKIKAFYYTKNIEPFDLPAYLKWTQCNAFSNCDLTGTCGATARSKHSASPTDCSRPKSVQSESSSNPEVVPEINKELDSNVRECAESNATVVIKLEETQDASNIDSVSAQSQSQELSFAEVAELVHSGKPIPGLAQVEVVPTNESPTPSQLPRAKKPWEE